MEGWALNRLVVVRGYPVRSVGENPLCGGQWHMLRGHQLERKNLGTSLWRRKEQSEGVTGRLK